MPEMPRRRAFRFRSRELAAEGPTSVSGLPAAGELTVQNNKLVHLILGIAVRGLERQGHARVGKSRVRLDGLCISTGQRRMLANPVILRIDR